MLNGIKILDFTNYIPGPYTSLRLSELGAEVIKVESPDGDPARHTENGYVFSAHNRGKKSIAIDLKTKEGQKLAKELIMKADVVIESFRPGVMDRFGLSYEDIEDLNPGIVYCSITGYGCSGPMSTLGSHDLNYMSLSGALSQLKGKDGRPVHPTNTFADYVGGLAASERILAALVSRFTTGRGSNHCISITDCMTSFMLNHVLIHKGMGNQNGVSILNGTVISYALYETSDGRYVSLAALEPKFWKHFCEAVHRTDWLSFQYSSPSDDNVVYQEMVQLFMNKSLQEWTEFALSTDCCLTPVLEVGELDTFPYFKRKEWISDSGQVKIHDEHDPNFSKMPPEKGEQTEQIIKEWLGASDKQISELKKAGVI